MPNFMVVRLRQAHTQSNRNDENPVCPADAPAPSRICARWFPRSPPRDRDAMPHRSASSTSLARLAARRARLHCDVGRADLVCNAHPPSVAAEPVGRPLHRGRKVELVIAGALRRTDKGLEAGVLPKLIAARESG